MVIQLPDSSRVDVEDITIGFVVRLMENVISSSSCYPTGQL